MRKFIFRIAVAMIFVLLIGDAARFLVIVKPAASDVIVVLAGETDKRPAGGVDLLRKGFAKHLILDVPADARVFQWNELDLAQRYLQALPDSDPMTVCPIHGLSTRDEAQDVAQCLKAVTARRVLLVTSDYHTRRALSTFKRVVPRYEYSVAGVYDPRQFGAEWWRHREWAKTMLYEWIRLAWWELVDRWRRPS